MRGSRKFCQRGKLKGFNLVQTCTDPGSFVRGDQTLTSFFSMKVESIQIQLKVGHHRPASETPFRWRAGDGP